MTEQIPGILQFFVDAVQKILDSPADGFLFWMMPDGMFRADGKYGQYCVVVPRKNAVIAINSMQIENEKKVLRAAVRTVLPLL